MSSIPLVLYHGGGCRDGHTCAWITNAFFQGRCECLPVNYGDPVPNVTDRDVYILDFSWKRPEMSRIISECRSLTVLDHHKSAEQELAGLELSLGPINITFDQEHSGAYLTWMYLFPDRAVPNLVKFVEDRDLWRFQLPNSREISASIDSYERTFDNWDLLYDLCNRDMLPLMLEGRAILRYQERLIEQHVRHAHSQTIGGVSVPTVNATCLNSEIGERLASGQPFSATYFINAAGDMVYSLRSSSEGTDVAEVAKLLGGGGHRNAAGFSVKARCDVW